MHIIGHGESEIIILHEVRPFALYIVHTGLMAIPRIKDTVYLLPLFVDPETRICDRPLTRTWGWTGDIFRVNLSGFLCWASFTRPYDASRKYGMQELTKLKEVFDRNSKRARP